MTVSLDSSIFVPEFHKTASRFYPSDLFEHLPFIIFSGKPHPSDKNGHMQPLVKLDHTKKGTDLFLRNRKKGTDLFLRNGEEREGGRFKKRGQIYF
ncbi:hypothetical protein [Desulfotignum phosphitoxidans]|uniref:hypothetical protein n=1 Tax=Desulfotignum phosphitoxidans TaxID=190898 RepID=UPI0012678F0F|nr:hypothetical protein [Desulfotignum phosphitoxidans]